jgi:hypothetical protein
MLAQDPCLNGLPIGEKFEWIPQKFVSEGGHGCCSKGTLQSISEKPNKKLKRNTLPSTAPQERVIQLPKDQCLIYFG